jgi:hypothetical protein
MKAKKLYLQMSKEEKINYVHCVFQELETLNISLPMGDYNLMYSYLEEVREFLHVTEEDKNEKKTG